MHKMARIILLGFVVSVSIAGANAQDASRAEMRSLDEQVQEIKSDVLGIAAELGRLEERLLYPSNSQVAVFLSLAEDEDFRLDAVELQLDGELVAHYIYSFKELEALQKGGVQRLYTGNVASGGHRLEVTVSGQSSNGREFSASESFSFSKDIEPKLLGLTLASSNSSGAAIRLGDW